MRKHIGAAWKVGQFIGEGIGSAYGGWSASDKRLREREQQETSQRLSLELSQADSLAKRVIQKRGAIGIQSDDDMCAWSIRIVDQALLFFCEDTPKGQFRSHLIGLMAQLCSYEKWFFVPSAPSENITRSGLWAWEDHLYRVEKLYENSEQFSQLLIRYLATLIEPIAKDHPSIFSQIEEKAPGIQFGANLEDQISDKAQRIEQIMHLSFSPELQDLKIFSHTQNRLMHNLRLASGCAPGKAVPDRQLKLPTKNKSVSEQDMSKVYLNGSPIQNLLKVSAPISMTQSARFEHMHIIAGSGHGKTQTLQRLILHDLDSVARGEASVIVMDSQSDLINNIARLECFAPGQPLADRLIVIDPTDIEWPVALNLFDAGLERLDQYEPLDRERLTNSILELYDFVLGSLLDAGMTQKQNVIFRYITRLLLHIPGATIHTLRELLEDGGSAKYQACIDKLEGSARNFFDKEFDGKEFVQTKRQVVRRLYGILENQTFERMFTHPKSKLDLFAEMNSGKVILINTAKDLLKEQGAEIFGRFFIALIAQAAQERAVLPKNERMPTFVYIDEASDYFDRNIGIILSQARKYNVGMVLAHQFLGQLEPRLQDAISANTSIKFAGGVSAKDARSLSNDLRTDAQFITEQPKLNFAAFIKGQTKGAVSIGIQPGLMEQTPQLTEEQRHLQRVVMRKRYAVHHSKLGKDAPSSAHENGVDTTPHDDGSPMAW